ncbi:MAG: hypothetical protein SFY67_01560 [Candidatus Melainabacteria bacterium]|nr:hypothetical protein [Candidatus Melainabacteria bacterium]
MPSIGDGWAFFVSSAKYGARFTKAECSIEQNCDDFLRFCNCHSQRFDSSVRSLNDSVIRRVFSQMKIIDSIIKERLTLVRIAGTAIIAVYLLHYFLTPGYITPFLNNPVARVLIFVFFGIFLMSSQLLLIFPKPRTAAARIAIGFYMICVVTPNVVLPILGPTFVRIGPCNMGAPMPKPEHPNRIEF